MKQIHDLIVGILVGSRWILTIFYLGLVLALLIYSFKFLEVTVGLCENFRTLSESDFIVAVLTMIDITMVANLIKMIVVGSYQNFVEKIATDQTEHITSGGLKIKMTGSLIGISSIHVLQSFMNPQHETNRDIFVKCAIHALFLCSLLILAVVEYLHTKGESHEK